MLPHAISIMNKQKTLLNFFTRSPAVQSPSTDTSPKSNILKNVCQSTPPSLKATNGQSKSSIPTPKSGTSENEPECETPKLLKLSRKRNVSDSKNKSSDSDDVNQNEVGKGKSKNVKRRRIVISSASEYSESSSSSNELSEIDSPKKLRVKVVRPPVAPIVPAATKIKLFRNPYGQLQVQGFSPGMQIIRLSDNRLQVSTLPTVQLSAQAPAPPAAPISMPTPTPIQVLAQGQQAQMKIPAAFSSNPTTSGLLQIRPLAPRPQKAVRPTRPIVVRLSAAPSMIPALSFGIQKAEGGVAPRQMILSSEKKIVARKEDVYSQQFVLTNAIKHPIAHEIPASPEKEDSQRLVQKKIIKGGVAKKPKECLINKKKMARLQALKKILKDNILKKRAVVEKEMQMEIQAEIQEIQVVENYKPRPIPTAPRKGLGKKKVAAKATLCKPHHGNTDNVRRARNGG